MDKSAWPHGGKPSRQNKQCRDTYRRKRNRRTKRQARVFVPERIGGTPYGGQIKARGPLRRLWCVPGLLQNQHPPRRPDAPTPRYVLSNLGVLENPTLLNGREAHKRYGGTQRVRFRESGLLAPFERVGAALLALVDAPPGGRCTDPLRVSGGRFHAVSPKH